MAKRELSLKPGEREPTFEEWHEVLTEIVDPTENLLQQTIEFFLRTTASGKAYLGGAKRLRPDLEIGPAMDLDEVLATYDAMTLLGKLIAEPRCGTDPTFKVWKDIWQGSEVGPSSYYTLAIEISRVLETRSKNEAEKMRLQVVRAALEDEFSMEVRFDEYLMFRREATKNPKA